MRQYEMKAEARTNAGSRSSRGLRREGRIPAVLCGHGVETRPLHVSVREFDEARKQHARIILLQLAGATEPAIIHDVAWDTITQEPLHVDFQRINMNEKVVVEVPIKTKGPSKGEADGGILVVQLDQVRVRCLPLEIPDQIDEKVANLGAIVEEKFHSIDGQFRERDTRSERESRDNKVAVDAAFAAQKEAASEQNKSNTLAISKSEVATQETINKLSELFRTTTDALGANISDLKDRVNRMESIRQGGTEARAGLSSGAGAIAAVGTIILAAIVIIGFVATRGGP